MQLRNKPNLDFKDKIMPFMKKLDGTLVSEFYLNKLKVRVDELKAQRGAPPHLCVILASDNAASRSYVNAKQKVCLAIGIRCTIHDLGVSFSRDELLATIKNCNVDDAIDGIIIQLPIYGISDNAEILDSIAHAKDVDGFNSINYGKMAKGLDSFIPATPKGIIMLLDYYHIDPKGLHTVVVGRGQTVGAPLAILMSLKQKMANSTVTLVHSHTRDLQYYTQQADILVAALGRPLFIDHTMIKTGVVIVDVGISKVADPSKKNGYRIVGDVNYDAVYDKCKYITPMPKGVGPMTITALLYNTVCAAEGNVCKKEKLSVKN